MTAARIIENITIYLFFVFQPRKLVQFFRRSTETYQEAEKGLKEANKMARQLHETLSNR